MPLEKDLRPGEKWVFDAAVAGHFDDMLYRSIPDYEGMRRWCRVLAKHFVRPDTSVVDLGCATGRCLFPFVGRQDVTAVGVDSSPDMLDIASDRLGPCAILHRTDLSEEGSYPTLARPASVTFCVLTLQFLPTGRRMPLLKEAFRATAPGGCLILVEKVLGPTVDACLLWRDLYREHKLSMGYTPEEVDAKEAALAGVLTPVDADYNASMLGAAGWQSVDTFWKALCFQGWVAIKT